MLDYGLILSVLVLLAAPLLSRLVEGMPSLKSALDGFVLMAIVGLIAFTLLPDALMHGGVVSLIVVLIGFSLPWLAELKFHKSEQITHKAILLVSVLAVVAHAMADGAILAFANNSSGGTFIASGIVLHRLGVAISIWWLLRPIFSFRGSMTILFALGAMTIIGYLMALYGDDWHGIPLVGYWQAFAAGSLFHIITHPINTHDHTDKEVPKPMLQAHQLGTALGVAFIAAMVLAQHLQHDYMSELNTHGEHLGHDSNSMLEAAVIAAPINLLLIAAFILWGRIKGGSFSGTYNSLQKIAPWTVLIWLAASMILTLQHDHHHHEAEHHHNSIVVIMWGVLVSGILVKMGARAFFATFMPRSLHNKHSH